MRRERGGFEFSNLGPKKNERWCRLIYVGGKAYLEIIWGKVTEEMIARESAATVGKRLNFSLSMSEAEMLISLTHVYTRS